ncbi:MAG: zinc-ribbon domain-containing protein [Eubacteriaceae bacterium]|nr:zinc-ribbon domain-containing protein [Eubacteriaceae bacterium]
MFENYYYETLIIGIILSALIMCAIPAIARAVHGPFSKKSSYFISFGNAFGIYAVFAIYYSYNGYDTYYFIPGGLLWIFVAWKILTSGNKEIIESKQKIILDEQAVKIKNQQEKWIEYALGNCNELIDKSQSAEKLFTVDEIKNFNNTYEKWLTLDVYSINDNDIKKGYYFLKFYKDNNQLDNAEKAAQKLIKADGLRKKTWTLTKEALMLDIYKELTKEDSLKFASGDIANKAYIWMSIANDSMSRTDFKRGYFYLKYLNANLQDKLAAEVSSKLLEVNRVFECRNIREAKMVSNLPIENNNINNQINTQNETKDKQISDFKNTTPYCRKCGNKLTEDSIFCTKCGTKIEEISLICPKCKKEISPDSEYCQYCGEKVV